MTDVLVAAFSDHDLVAHMAASEHPPLQVRDYEGITGRSDHITRGENGMIPLDAIRHLHGVNGERPGEHSRQGERWESLKRDVAENGITNPIFITVDYGDEPKISEGNNRRDLAAELGHSHVPVEIRYFGHAEQQGSVLERAMRRQAAARPPRGSEACNCCAGKGTHRDGSECKRCENGSISKDDQKTKPYCDGQRAPRRRRWRQVQAAGVMHMFAWAPAGAHVAVNMYHGSDNPEPFERFDFSKRSLKHQDEEEYVRHIGEEPVETRWWNSRLGSHFSSHHSVAAEAARSHGGDGHIYHVDVRLKNPKDYASEHDLAEEGVQWARKKGYGGLRNLGYDTHRGWHHAEALQEHPQAQEIANGFRRHLQSQGYDGITYGNEYEEPIGHKCAIIFHPDQAHITETHGAYEHCADDPDEDMQHEGMIHCAMAGWDPVKEDRAQHAVSLWGKDKPHTAVTQIAQSKTAFDHPRMHMQLPEPENDPHDFFPNESHVGGKVMEGMLQAAGFSPEQARGAFVVRHPEGKSASNAAFRGSKMGAALHPHRWDYGTLAHETAHHWAIWKNAWAPNDHSLDDADIHGHDFTQAYSRTLNYLSPGAGDDYLRHHADASTLVGRYRKRVHGLSEELPGQRMEFDAALRETAGVEDEYGMQHRPTEDAPTVDRVEEQFAGVHEHPEWYHSEPLLYREGIAQLRKVRGKPEAPVTIYRASPADTPARMRTGDWVSLDRNYAHFHRWSQGYADEKGGRPWAVRKAVVPAKHVRDAGTGPANEQGYWGPDIDAQEDTAPRPDHLFEKEAAEDTSYRMLHQGPDPEDSEGLHEIGTGKIWPADFHERAHEYYLGATDESIDKVHRSKGWPSRKVWAYRALPSPHREINPGDWVSTSKEYAMQEARHSKNRDDDYPVVKFQARAEQLRNEGNSLDEWSYHGPPIQRALVHHSGGKNHRGKGPRGAGTDAMAHEHEPEDMFRQYEADNSAHKRRLREQRQQRLGARTENVKHIINHFKPSDFDTWDEVRNNIDWEAPEPKAFLEHVRANGVQRAIPIDYEQDPPVVMNGHTRLMAAYLTHQSKVPVRQHEGWMDPDDPDHLGRQESGPWLREGDPEATTRREAARVGAPGDNQDWQQALDRLRYRKRNEPMMHRGLAVELPPEVHDFVHDHFQSRDRQARAIVEHLSQQPLGMHWSAEQQTPRHFADWERKHNLPGSTKIILHAALPEVEHIETDPDKLREEAVFRHDSWMTPEHEIPIKAGAPVNIKAVTWYGYGNRKRTGYLWNQVHQAARTPFRIEYESRGSYTPRWLPGSGDPGPRQDYGTYHAYHPETGAHAGRLDFSTVNYESPEAHVEWVESKHPGAASALLDRLYEEHPGHEVHHGYQTDEGAPFINKYLSERPHLRSRSHFGSLHTAVAETYGPQPEWQPPPEGTSEEEKSAAVYRNIDERREWKRHIQRGLSLGHLTGEHARSLGYYPSGHATETGTGRSLWQSLPHDMYHVTTDLASVRRHGLKTRAELGQMQGHGLGGGEDDTISTTTDHELAGHILHGLHEFHDVVNHKYTPQQMWDDAKAGKGAERPYHHLIAQHWSSGWKHGDPLPMGLEHGLRGREVRQGGMLGSQEEIRAKHGPGWEPADEGIDVPKGRLHYTWSRPMDPDQKREFAATVYKRFSAGREHAGGPEDPMFFSTDTKAFADKDPKNFAILHVHPRKGAQGYPLHGMGEWRTGTGDALHVHHYEQEHGGQLHEAARSEMPDYRDRDALEAHLRIEHGWIPRKIDAMARGRYGLVHAHHTEHSEAARLDRPHDHEHDRWEGGPDASSSFIASVTPKAHQELIEHMISVHHFPSPEWRTADQLAETHDMEHGYNEAEKREAGIEPHRHDDEWEVEHSGWESGPDVFTGARKTAGWREDREARGDRWYEFRNRYSDDLHRGVLATLPEQLHAYVHDESQPRDKRAQALAQHFADSGGLGMHWTPHTDIASRAIGNAADEKYPPWFDDDDERDHYWDTRGDPKTSVMFHIRRPAQRSVLRNRDELERHQVGWSYSKDEDEVPVKPGAPLHLTGISWKPHESEYPNEPFEHYDFAKPLRAQGAAGPGYSQHKFYSGTMDPKDLVPTEFIAAERWGEPGSPQRARGGGRYLDEVKRDVAEHGMLTPINVDYDIRSRDKKPRPYIGQGHHRRQVGIELGIDVPVSLSSAHGVPPQLKNPKEITREEWNAHTNGWAWGSPSRYAVKRPSVTFQRKGGAIHRSHAAWYHGTGYELPEGHRLTSEEADRLGRVHDHRDKGWMYFTNSIPDAQSFARMEVSTHNQLWPHDPHEPHLYEIEPEGEHEEDPNLPGMGAYRTRHPLRVVRRLSKASIQDQPPGEIDHDSRDPLVAHMAGAR